MRLLTYLIAVALLWAVATSGPAAAPNPSDAPVSARPERRPSGP
jgi:hypothetical protein